jgi:hypothetical protein
MNGIPAHKNIYWSSVSICCAVSNTGVNILHTRTTTEYQGYMPRYYFIQYKYVKKIEIGFLVARQNKTHSNLMSVINSDKYAIFLADRT